jgi:hypothetical protein
LLLRVIANLVLVFGDGKYHAGIKSLSGDAITVHLGPVSTIQILDKPISLLKGKAAMLAGDICESENDIAVLSPTYQNTVFLKWNVFATTGWY